MLVLYHIEGEIKKAGINPSLSIARATAIVSQRQSRQEVPRVDTLHSPRAPDACGKCIYSLRRPGASLNQRNQSML